MTQKDDRDQPLVKKEAHSVLPEDQYCSVEFYIKDLGFNYQFKIWETKNPEIDILVNRNSIILEHLKVGNKFDIKYYPSDFSRYPVTMRTEIKHIKENSDRRLNGHCLVGLAVN